MNLITDPDPVIGTRAQNKSTDLSENQRFILQQAELKQRRQEREISWVEETEQVFSGTMV